MANERIDIILPYRTDWREMHRVLDYCKGKGADRAVLDARFGGGESLRETLNALEQLDLIVRSEAGDVQLTDAGDRLAYAPDEADRRRQLVEAMLRYWPYRVPLERAIDERLPILDAPVVEHIWQVDMRLGQPRNRVEEARTFFFRLADDAGLGTYRRGVRGQSTRLEMDPDAAGTIVDALGAVSEPSPEPLDTEERELSEPESAAPPPVDAVLRLPPSRPTSQSAQLSIQVDMSDWDLEKIEAFLTMIGYLDPPGDGER